MSLADLRASLEETSAGAPVAGDEPASAPAEEQPYGVAQVVTPSGLEIYYQAGPKRLYRIRQHYAHDWVDISNSISEVLDVLGKGGLPWWGMKVGVAGALQVCTEVDFTSDKELLDLDGAYLQEIIDRLTAAKLTVNHVKESAGDRGTNVHKALERYAETGVMPDPQFWPANERGYVEGVAEFIRDAQPKIELSEVMVASLEGWAGRFDAVAEIDAEVNVRCYPKRKPKRERVTGRWLLDLKTSKGVYESYKIQVAAYRQGLIECGYGDVDHAGIVRVTRDGKYELVESEAVYQDFLNVLATYHTVRRLK